MPYIDPKFRKQLDPYIDALALAVYKVYREEQDKAVAEGRTRYQTRDGLLNYAFTRVTNQTYPDPNYHDMNEKIGMYECAKLENYRTLAAPYEDLKIDQNGDVATYTKDEMEKRLAEFIQKEKENDK